MITQTYDAPSHLPASIKAQAGKEIADQNGYLFYVVNDEGSTEYRWQDNFVLEWLIDDVLRHLLRKRTTIKDNNQLDMHNFNTMIMKRKRIHNKKDNTLKPTPRVPPSNNSNLKTSTRMTTNNRTINFPRSPIVSESHKGNIGAIAGAGNTRNYDGRNKTPVKHIKQLKPATEPLKKTKFFQTSSKCNEKENSSSISLPRKRRVGDSRLEEVTNSIKQRLEPSKPKNVDPHV